jgi:cell division protein ZipA
MGFRMDFGLRDWLFILGPIFIIGVLAHGYWRMRVNRNSLKMSLDKSFLNSRNHPQDGAAEVEKMRAELPNGGARVVSEPRQVSLNLEDDVPVLMEPVHSPEQSQDSDMVTDSAEALVLEPGMPAPVMPESIMSEPTLLEPTVLEPTMPEPTVPEPTVPEPTKPRPIDHAAFGNTAFGNTAFGNTAFGNTDEVILDRGNLGSAVERPTKLLEADRSSQVDILFEEESAPESHTAHEPAVTVPLRAVVGCPEKYLVLYVVAKNKDFRGDTLRSCLKKQQMHFGEMAIFHRLSADDRSEFSLVNAIEPGTFDPDTMASMTTPALSLFMRAHELANPIASYHEMLAVAEALAKTLNGEVRDESRQPLSRQTMEHYQADLQIFVDTHFR